MTLRALDPVADFDAVAALQLEAADYWLLADRQPPDARQKAVEFFTDAPPGVDPACAQRLGLFQGGRLSGLAELSFGFPAAGDAFLGLMILAPRARGMGFGTACLAGIEARARALANAGAAPVLYLAVLEENRRGHAFWARHGFQPTGVSRHDEPTGHTLHRLAKLL